jgi:hypothetical protein
MEKEKVSFTGSDTEGGITSGYQMNDGVALKVPYSFFGSIYDEDDERMVLEAMKQDSQTMGPQVQLFQKEFARKFGIKHAFATSNCTTAMHIATQVFGIKAGDEVIVTPNTFIATSLVVKRRRKARLFGHRSQNFQHRSEEDRGEGDKTHQSHLCRSLRRLNVRHGPDHGDRAEA